MSGLARKCFPICDCTGDWLEDAEALLNDEIGVYMDNVSTMDGCCPRCYMYPWGTAHNDNMMRDLQEMNQ